MGTPAPAPHPVGGYSLMPEGREGERRRHAECETSELEESAREQLESRMARAPSDRRGLWNVMSMGLGFLLIMGGRAPHAPRVGGWPALHATAVGISVATCQCLNVVLWG
jgi:hypothetical protein